MVSEFSDKMRKEANSKGKNKNEDKLEEDYIDLLPILDNLYIESAEFLAPIKKVEVSYD